MKKALTQAEKAAFQAKQNTLQVETIVHLASCIPLGVVAPYMEYDELMHWVGGEYPPVVTPTELAMVGAYLYAAEAYFEKYGAGEKPTNEKVTFEHALGKVFCTLTTGGDLVLWK